MKAEAEVQRLVGNGRVTRGERGRGCAASLFVRSSYKQPTTYSPPLSEELVVPHVRGTTSASSCVVVVGGWMVAGEGVVVVR